MAKDKEKKQQNPATAALKAAKNRTISKQKAAVAAQRSERLAKRNPERIQRQIDELKQAREAAGGVLNARDRKQLEELERDVGRIQKAREKSGMKPDERKGGEREQRDGDRGILGKRGRDGENARERFREPRRQRTPESETDDEAKSIPMPLDIENMPPIPRKPRVRHALPDAPTQADLELAPVAQTTYSSAPQLRDLHKEAVSRFVPAAVASKIAAVKGEGARLLEPEEADALEAAGYTAAKAQKKETDLIAKKTADEAEKEVEFRMMARENREGPAQSLEEEERRFQQEVRNVEMEDVEDEDL
jgi:hypothetical protein